MADKSLASLVKQADRQLGLFDRPSPPKPAPARSGASTLPSTVLLEETRRAAARWSSPEAHLQHLTRARDSAVVRLQALRGTIRTEPARYRIAMGTVSDAQAELEGAQKFYQRGSWEKKAVAVPLPPPPPPITLSRPEITTRTLKTISMSRYNGGVKAKRQYGSATITKFDVWDERWPRVIVSVDVGGASAGERTTAAKQRALPLLETELRKKGLL